MSRPLLDQTLFLDRALGTIDVPAALKEAGINYELHRDYFADTELDEIWVPEVTRRGWPIVTKDDHMKTRQLERIAIEQAGAMIFVLRSPKGLTGPDMGKAFVIAYRKLCKYVRDYAPPFIAKVTAGGDVEMPEHVQRRAGIKK